MSVLKKTYALSLLLYCIMYLITNISCNWLYSIYIESWPITFNFQWNHALIQNRAKLSQIKMGGLNVIYPCFKAYWKYVLKLIVNNSYIQNNSNIPALPWYQAWRAKPLVVPMDSSSNSTKLPYAWARPMPLLENDHAIKPIYSNRAVSDIWGSTTCCKHRHAVPVKKLKFSGMNLAQEDVRIGLSIAILNTTKLV